MTDHIKLRSGPDEWDVRKVDSGSVAFTGTGPRGGYISGPWLDAENAEKLRRFLNEQAGVFLCHSCNRAEDDCSADPCAAVIADREAVVEIAR